MAVVNVTKASFDSEVLKSEQPVLIDFWAAWCGPCRMVSPIVDEVADEVQDVKVCKVNIDEEAELAQLFQVSSIPTLVFMKQGKVVDTTVGAVPKNSILKMIGK